MKKQSKTSLRRRVKLQTKSWKSIAGFETVFFTCLICLLPILYLYSVVHHHRIVRLRYCGDGHYFQFIVVKLRDTFQKFSVTLQISDTRPDIILGSTGDMCSEYHGVPRITVLGENILEGKHSYLQDLGRISTVVLHCVKTSKSLQNFIYYPFWVASFGERKVHKPQHLLKSKYSISHFLSQKRKFCAFMYSHASPGRDRLLSVLQSYKRVDILGPYPDTGQNHDRNVYNETMTFYDLAVDHYLPYKFVIAGENSFNPGYITEKIINAMLAYSIPIYLGAPDVSEVFNPKSFVNANAMSEEDLLRLIHTLDTNDEAYHRVMMEPWFFGNKLPNWFDKNNLSSLISPIIQSVLQRS